MSSISLSSIQHELLLLTETFAPFQVSFIFTVELTKVLKRELQLTCDILEFALQKGKRTKEID